MIFFFKLLRKLVKCVLAEDATKSLAELYPKDSFGRGTYCRGLPKLRILRWDPDEKLIVGNFCSIAVDTKIFLGGNHRPEWVTTYPFNKFWKEASHIEGSPFSKGDVIIGNDVWIGNGAVILSGVKINDGAVIGASAVVSMDVPPYAIVVGNPARVVKFRFDDDTILKLLDLKWWDWSDDRILQKVDLLQSGDVEKFLDEATKE
ncbi:CatB-related O-acetyltransferase [Rubritalea marina]|uniref:CatB-related O-acetyltransferase n=1 Tax=Rubritalea marina TaxID=361055 RepID=UPI0003657EDF|nr:CatB-related O-acetyltransferase [Rubritalea marina]